MPLFMNQDSYAENPGNVNLSRKKCRQLKKRLCKNFVLKINFDLNRIPVSRWIRFGDTQPAFVYSVDPLTISVYSDEMDAVIFLRFPDFLVEQYGLKEGEVLAATNVYSENSEGKTADDIFVGEHYLGRYHDFTPMIQLFLSDDEATAKRNTGLFHPETLLRVQALTAEYADRHSGLFREGFYYFFQ